MDEAERRLRGPGRDAALELLRGAREAWKWRCNDIEGEPVEIQLRLERGRYLGGRRFSARTLREGCRLLARLCPELLVDIGGGRYWFPFSEFKTPGSLRLERLEGWRRQRQTERRANPATGLRSEHEMQDPASGLKGNARAIPFPRYALEFGSSESEAGMSLEVRAAAAWRDLCRLGPAVEGEGGDRRTFVACCIPTDYGLPEDVAEDLLERWGRTCRPPWSPREFLKKKGSASRNRKRPVGYKAPGLASPPDQRRVSAGAPPSGGLAISARSWWDEAPSLAELEAVGPVEWLQSRGIDPRVLAARDLARVLPGFGRLPRWARIGGQTWAEAGIRLILPVYGADGELGGVRGRWTGPVGHVGEGGGAVEASQTKEVAPWGQRSAGLVYANAAARAMLRGEAVFDVVTVVEGAPDFLTLAALTEAPVLGVFSGSWTAELAARIPDGAQVLIATHGDRAGEGYARRIAATLLRRCVVGRMRLPAGCDLNDAHRRGELAGAEVERLELFDLEIPASLLERPGLCMWDRRALWLLGRHAQRFRGHVRELARVLLTVGEFPAEATAVKGLARALVRLSERRELPPGIEIEVGLGERGELGLGGVDEDRERDADVAVMGGVPGVQGGAADQTGPVVVDDGSGGLWVAAGAEAGGAGDESCGAEAEHHPELTCGVRSGRSGLQMPPEQEESVWRRHAEAELVAAGVGEGRVFELGELDLGDGKPQSVGTGNGEGRSLELAELVARVEQGAEQLPEDGKKSVREAAESELMRALARATAAVRDRLRRRGREGPT